MAKAVKVKLDGLTALLRELKHVDAKVAKKAVRKATLAGAKIINKGAKRRARRRTGALARSIGQKVKVYRPSGTAVAIVGPRKGSKVVVNVNGKPIPIDPVKYAHLVEYGTQHSRAFPFLRETLVQEKQAIETAIAEVIREAVK